MLQTRIPVDMDRHRYTFFAVLLTFLLFTGAAAADFNLRIEDASANTLTVKGVYTPGNETPVELFCAINESVSTHRLSDRDASPAVDWEKRAWQCTRKRWENHGVISCSMQPPEQETEDLSDAEICRECHLAPEHGMTVERCRKLYCNNGNGEETDTAKPTVAYDRANTVSCALRRWQEKNGEYYARDDRASIQLFNGTVNTGAATPGTQYQGRSINATCTLHNTGNTLLLGEDQPRLIQYRATVTVDGAEHTITGDDIRPGTVKNITGAVPLPFSVEPGSAAVRCSQVSAAGHLLGTSSQTSQIRVEQPPFHIRTVQVRRQGTVNTSTATPFETVVFEGEIEEHADNVSYTATITRDGSTVATPPIHVENGGFQVRYTPGETALPGTYHAEVTGATEEYTETRQAAFTVEPGEGAALVNLSWVTTPPNRLKDRFQFAFKLVRGSSTVPASFVENVSCGVVNNTGDNLLNPVIVERTERETYAATYTAPGDVDEGFFACDVALAGDRSIRLQDWYLNASPWPLLVGFAVFILVVLGIITGGIVKWRSSGISREEKIEALKRKLRSVRDAKQEAQRKYFQRNLDEDTFTEMMQQYKENEMQLEAELAHLKTEK